MQLTFREVETAFEIDEKTLFHWLNSRGMPAVKADDRYYFNSVEVLEWALKNHIALTPGALKLCEQKRQGLDLFTPALRRGGIYFDVPGDHREDVLINVLQTLPLPEQIQKEPLKEILFSQQQMGTTGIGNGIAIPHVKHPVILAGTEPMLGLFFLRSPVDFNALDGLPVHTLFMILSSSFKSHLSLLSRLAFCLQDQTVQAILTNHKNREDIFAAFQVAESKIAKPV
jgi:nitrogen PTS system EIIA component